jgi:hypothetical protein
LSIVVRFRYYYISGQLQKQKFAERPRVLQGAEIDEYGFSPVIMKAKQVLQLVAAHHFGGMRIDSDPSGNRR